MGGCLWEGVGGYTIVEVGGFGLVGSILGGPPHGAPAGRRPQSTIVRARGLHLERASKGCVWRTMRASHGEGWAVGSGHRRDNANDREKYTVDSHASRKVWKRVYVSALLRAPHHSLSLCLLSAYNSQDRIVFCNGKRPFVKNAETNAVALTGVFLVKVALY